MKNIKRKNNIRAYRLAVQQKSDFTIFSDFEYIPPDMGGNVFI